MRRTPISYIAIGLCAVTLSLAPVAAGAATQQSQAPAQPAPKEADPPREGTKGQVVAEDAKDAAKATGRAVGKAADKTGDAVETAVDKTGSAIGKAASATKDAVVTGAKKTADVVSDAPERIDETWITAKIASKINADDALEHVDVDVKVRKNVVTITGEVPSTELRDRVLRIARETEGVSRVVDGMAVKPGRGTEQ